MFKILINILWIFFVYFTGHSEYFYLPIIIGILWFSNEWIYLNERIKMSKCFGNNPKGKLIADTWEAHQRKLTYNKLIDYVHTSTLFIYSGFVLIYYFVTLIEN